MGAPSGDLLHLGEFGVRAGEADLQSFGLAVPAARFGFGDAGEEIVADLFKARPGGGVGSQQRAAPDNCVHGLPRNFGVLRVMALRS